jgi:hypothetical protein
MKFSHERRERPVELAPEDDTHIPLTLSAACLGTQCPRFAGTTCKSREDLLVTDGKPPRFASEEAAPLRKGANYAMYGRVCTTGEPELVALRAEMLDPSVTGAEIISFAETITSGNLPLDIHRPGQEPGRVTIFATDQPEY